MKDKENLRVRRVKVEVKGQMIEYDEYYLLDKDGAEIFEREIEIENDERLYDIYKKQNHLLTSLEIKKIRKKYGLTQKEYALVIGVGEITVHRFEKGSIQTDAVDAIMKLSDDPDNMAFLLLQNRENIPLQLYDFLSKRVEELQTLKKHAIVDITKIDSSNLEWQGSTAIVVAQNIIKKYNDKVNKLVQKYELIPEYITNLKLQKLLYYVQAISLLCFGKQAYSEKIYAWAYGPVIEEVYQQYRDYHAREIEINQKVGKLSSGLSKIIDEVVEHYGSFEANKLIDFTHEEDPWKNASRNAEITTNSILEYFYKVYDCEF